MLNNFKVCTPGIVSYNSQLEFGGNIRIIESNLYIDNLGLINLNTVSFHSINGGIIDTNMMSSIVSITSDESVQIVERRYVLIKYIRNGETIWALIDTQQRIVHRRNGVIQNYDGSTANVEFNRLGRIGDIIRIENTNILVDLNEGITTLDPVSEVIST